jgi:hypothetical protein
LAPPEQTSDPTEIRALSRASYGRPIGEIEADISRLVVEEGAAEGSIGSRPRRRS